MKTGQTDKNIVTKYRGCRPLIVVSNESASYVAPQQAGRVVVGWQMRSKDTAHRTELIASAGRASIPNRRVSLLSPLSIIFHQADGVVTGFGIGWAGPRRYEQFSQQCRVARQRSDEAMQVAIVVGTPECFRVKTDRLQPQRITAMFSSLSDTSLLLHRA